MEKRGLHKLFYIILISFIIILDQVVKYLSVLYLKPLTTLPVINGVFHLTYCENSGAAFSMLEGSRWFFISITFIFVALIVFVLFTDRILSRPAAYCLAAIAAGGLGNLIDRIFQGYVVDMFDFRLINFAVFNVADIAVTCGGVAFVVIYIVKKGEVFKWKK